MLGPFRRLSRRRWRRHRLRLALEFERGVGAEDAFIGDDATGFLDDHLARLVMGRQLPRETRRLLARRTFAARRRFAFLDDSPAATRQGHDAINVASQHVTSACSLAGNAA